MKAKNQLKLCLLGLGAALAFPAPALAADFESIGVVTRIDLGKNLITVDESEEEKTYYLPNSTTLNGAPAIFYINQGSLISFSGESDGSTPTVNSIYVFPAEDQRSQP